MAKKEKKRVTVGRIIKIICIVVCALLLVPLIVIEAGRIVTLLRNRITSEHGVDENIYVDLCGQQQRLLVRGENTDNPVVIWLHGGPGGSDTYANYYFQRYLLSDYTFINWDQRGCGSTYYRNRADDPDNETASFGQALDDLDALVDYARERFGKDKVIIAGHSYGTMLGTRYVALHPEKVTAYVGTGQVVCMNEKSSYEHALTLAKQNGDDTSALEAAFKAYSEEPGSDSIYMEKYEQMKTLRSEMSKYNTAPRQANTIPIGAFSPYMKINDLRWFLQPMVNSEEEYIGMNRQLIEEMYLYNVYDYQAEYGVPMIFIGGSCDWTTPAVDAKEYAGSVTAPYVSWNELEGCGHIPQFDAPEEYAEIFSRELKASLAAD